MNTLCTVKSSGDIVVIIQGLNEGGRVDKGGEPVVGYIVQNTNGLRYAVDRKDIGSYSIERREDMVRLENYRYHMAITSLTSPPRSTKSFIGMVPSRICS